MHSTSVRIDADSHEELKRLAQDLGTTVGHTVTLAVAPFVRKVSATNSRGHYEPTSSPGDVVDLDLGMPEGREAGFGHPAVVVTAQRILHANPQ